VDNPSTTKIKQYFSLRNSTSARSLLIANAIALLGVLIFNWSLFSIVFAYWLENVIIGIITIMKILKAEAPNPSSMKINGRPVKGSAKAFLVPFFMAHFGIFTFVHGVFVFAIFGFNFIRSNATSEIGGAPWPGLMSNIDFSIIGFLTMAIALAISHGISYKTNFIDNKEYKKVSPGAAMFAPYSRVIVLHIVILGSGFILGFFGINLISAIIIITAKTIIDYLLHRREHTKIWRGAHMKVGNKRLTT